MEELDMSFIQKFVKDVEGLEGKVIREVKVPGCLSHQKHFPCCDVGSCRIPVWDVCA